VISFRFFVLLAFLVSCEVPASQSNRGTGEPSERKGRAGLYAERRMLTVVCPCCALAFHKAEKDEKDSASARKLGGLGHRQPDCACLHNAGGRESPRLADWLRLGPPRDAQTLTLRHIYPWRISKTSWAWPVPRVIDLPLAQSNHPTAVAHAEKRREKGEPSCGFCCVSCVGSLDESDRRPNNAISARSRRFCFCSCWRSRRAAMDSGSYCPGKHKRHCFC